MAEAFGLDSRIENGDLKQESCQEKKDEIEATWENKRWRVTDKYFFHVHFHAYHLPDYPETES